MLDINLLARVTAFLNLEADILDMKEYDQWLDLWLKEGLYIVPVDHDVDDYSETLNIAYDDDEMRQLRVARLKNGEAVSTADAKPTVRTVSRVRILDASPDLIHVRSAYCLFEDNKYGIRQFPANVEFKLVPNGDTFLIKEKVVKIMKSDQHLTTICYIF